ncbi:MAG TPA: polysaccharide deacetylase family protein, partial [Bacteroidota bacterium]|nr:polysaccharide deacetylase family protein [Bacteroidota bacterium]
MILMYHKVHPETPTKWWVSVDEFWRQMEELQRYIVVSLDRYDPTDPKHVCITFDGVYENVYQFAVPILKKFGYPFELFITGGSIGQGNEFDAGEEPPARFASREQLKRCIEAGGRLQWHTTSHPDLTAVDGRALEHE